MMKPLTEIRDERALAYIRSPYKIATPIEAFREGWNDAMRERKKSDTYVTLAYACVTIAYSVITLLVIGAKR